MSEKFNSQGEEYRDGLAESLKTKRDLGEDGKELAKDQLELEKDTVEYKRAEIQHKEDNLVAKKEKAEEGAESIESSKLEWGPDLGQLSWNTAQVKIEKLNKDLKKGEKPWRLPTKDELVAEFNKAGKTPAGFERRYYWSGTTRPQDSDYAYYVSMGSGLVYFLKDLPNILVRCVR